MITVFKPNSVCEMSQGHLMSSLVLNRVTKDDFCAKKGHCLKSSATLVPKTPLSAAPGFCVPKIFL